MRTLPSSSADEPDLRRVALIAAAFIILASPTWLQRWWGQFSGFPAVSMVYLLAIAALVATWAEAPATQPRARVTLPAVLAGAAALGLVAWAARRFVDVVLLNPPDTQWGDMLAVIEQAGHRFMRGRDPYGTYQVPWEVSLPYGPPLWAPFLVPEALRIDLRLLTTVGQIFVPICCGLTALWEAARERPVSAVAWLVLLAVMVFDPHLLLFVRVGHTPAYWPLLPLLALLVASRRWYAAAAVLGVLVAGRATMVAMVPVFLMGVWFRDRNRTLTAALVFAAVVAAILVPFFIWDPVAMWRGMITNYAERIKDIVWPSSDLGAIRTIGLTGWLLSHGFGRLVDPSLGCALAIVWAISWRALSRGAAVLPHMALALFALSMTTVWPVYYIHFDVVLLLASAGIAEVAGVMPARRALSLGVVVLLCAAGLVAMTVRLMASPHPALVIEAAEGRLLLRQGFAGVEDDGARRFSWIEGRRAVVLLPRSAASEADVVLTGLPFAPAGSAPLAISPILNGVPLGTKLADGNWQTVSFEAPARAWRIGANQLELQFSPTSSPKELGLGDDPRRLAMALERLDVRPR